MKNIFTLLALLTLTMCSFSQTFLTEDFSEGIMPPTGWTIDNYADQWNSNQSNNAEGSAPEARFSYIDNIGTSRMISPEVDLTGFGSVTLKFKHYLDDWTNNENYFLGVATKSGGGDWNIVWQVEPLYNIGPEEKIITIENDDVGAVDFQFCIFIDGNLNNLNYWYIDDVLLFSAFNLDAQMLSIDTYPFVTETARISGTVCNQGLVPITSLEISWRANGQNIYSTSFSGFNLNAGESYEFECNDTFNYPIGTYELEVWIIRVNGTIDDNPENDLLSKTISVVSHSVFKRPMFEQFANSNSYISFSVNSHFVPWCEEHAETLTLLKYPWRRPYPADPYYTEECKAREEYYTLYNEDVYIYGNGSDVGLSNLDIHFFYQDAIIEPGFASIVSSRSSVNRGTIMDIDVTILPFASFNSHKLFLAVFEKTTTGNIGTNGETEFKHILMKMVPDPYGTEIFLDDREPVTISQSIDLAGTNIEEWDDLGVAIFIQDYDSREIFQSTYAIENANFASDATLIDLTVNSSSVSGFSPDTYDYNVELPAGTTVVPEVIGIPTDENATVIVVPANELPGTTTVEVFAEDLTTKLTYTVNLTVITGLEDPVSLNVFVHPNPTTGIVNITGIVDAKIEVYSISGKLVSRFENSNGHILDLSSHKNGIYIIKILEDDFITTKRIVLCGE